ncbi:MAG: hypothetical protein KDD04_09950, partial [Sinomicrobium sp.]|nr:hypothetical protein [Sinomicrobium sp.]
MKYLLAATHGDDGLLAYDAVLRFPERFRGDLMSLVVNSYFKGSLMNYGSVFLNRAAGIPLILLCCIYVFWMRFAMPLFFTTVLGSRLSIEERSVVFFISLLAGIEAWNLANYGAHNEMPIPYAGAVAFPFFMGGLYLFSCGRKTGILPLLFGALIHPSMGLYAAVTLGLYFLSSPGPGKLKNLIWPFIVALTAAAPS